MEGRGVVGAPMLVLQVCEKQCCGNNGYYQHPVPVHNGVRTSHTTSPSWTTPLPSEVKYSASLVQLIGCCNVILGTVMFILGVIGTRVEPETCWSGAGIWSGMTVITSGVCGVLAHRLWYKNWTIKIFLISSTISQVMITAAIVITLYSLTTRHQYKELYNNNRFHSQLDSEDNTNDGITISVNLVIGQILATILGIWSLKVSWNGVRAQEFTPERRHKMMMVQAQKYKELEHGHPTSQGPPPLAALYQLLEAHPELIEKGMWAGGDNPMSKSSMNNDELLTRYLQQTFQHNHDLRSSYCVPELSAVDEPKYAELPKKNQFVKNKKNFAPQLAKIVTVSDEQNWSDKARINNNTNSDEQSDVSQPKETEEFTESDLKNETGDNSVTGSSIISSCSKSSSTSTIPVINQSDNIEHSENVSIEPHSKVTKTEPNLSDLVNCDNGETNNSKIPNGVTCLTNTKNNKTEINSTLKNESLDMENTKCDNTIKSLTASNTDSIPDLQSNIEVNNQSLENKDTYTKL